MLRKKILFAVLSIGTILSVLAFTQSNKTKAMPQRIEAKAQPFTNYYFHYIGPSTPTNYYDYFNVNNYVMLAIGENEDDYCEPGYDAICVILAPRLWTGTKYVPDLMDNTPGGIKSQLHHYYFFHEAGSLIFTKETY